MRRCRTRPGPPVEVSRRGFSLMELVVGLAVSGILLFALTGAIMIASRSVEAGPGSATRAVDASSVIDQITTELRLATSFSERTATSVSFTVPDQTGDGLPDAISYEWTGSPLFQLTRQINSAEKNVLAEDVRHFSFEYLTKFMEGVPPPTSGELPPTVLLVVPDPDTLNSRDTLRRTLLITWEYAVELIAASDSQENFDAAVASADAAYVSEEIDPAELGVKLRDAAIGVVNEEGGLIDEFGLAPGLDWVKEDEYIALAVIVHPITEGLVTPLRIFEGKKNLNQIKVSSVAPGAQVLAYKRDDANLCCLITAKRGDLLISGSAPARRAQLPWGSDSDITKLSDGGKELMRRTVEWVMASEEEEEAGGPGPQATFGNDTIYSTPVSSVRRLQIGTRVQLTEGGTVTSVSAYVLGDGKDARLAVYSDALGEPDTLVVESETVNPDGPDWFTLEVSPTHLDAGWYWLALSFDANSQTYYQQSSGETRYVPGRATADGFLYNWGTSTADYDISVSIYATYTPD